MTPTVGSLVEIQDEGWKGTDYFGAVVVEQPADRPTPNDREVWVWVRYDSSGDVVPVREWRVLERRTTA